MGVSSAAKIEMLRILTISWLSERDDRVSQVESMSTWLWSSSSSTLPSFDSTLLEITADTLPSIDLRAGLESDIERALDLSDLIRSGAIKPVEALKSFKKRLGATQNPKYAFL